MELTRVLTGLLAFSVVFLPGRAAAEAISSEEEIVSAESVSAEGESETMDLADESGDEQEAGELGGNEYAVSELDSSELDSGVDRPLSDRFWLNYFGIYYGSSMTSPSKYQSSPFTDKDPNRPLLVKNFLTLGYDINEKIALAGTGYFTWTPVTQVTPDSWNLQDPSVRIAHNSILSFGGFNWYGDARMHFPVTSLSRENDLLAGFQTFHFFSYQGDESRWLFGLYSSARYNHFGSLGVGNDLELYLAPSANFELSPTLALTFLYEMGASHTYGDEAGNLDNDGTDFQPGVLWRITPKLEFNPYLNIYTGGRINLATTSVGMTLSWMLL